MFKINTNLVWTSHNTGGVEFNTGVFAVYVNEAKWVDWSMRKQITPLKEDPTPDPDPDQDSICQYYGYNSRSSLSQQFPTHVYIVGLNFLKIAMFSTIEPCKSLEKNYVRGMSHFGFSLTSVQL